MITQQIKTLIKEPKIDTGFFPISNYTQWDSQNNLCQHKTSAINEWRCEGTKHLDVTHHMTAVNTGQDSSHQPLCTS